MNTSLIIRKASPGDIPVIRHIAHTTWPVAYGSTLLKEQLDYMLQWMYSEAALLEQMQKGHQFYIAAINNMDLGFASVSAEDDGSFKLNKLYVIPDTQKTGAGKALLQQTILYTQQNGGTRLLLQVKRDNIAKGFYEKHGFTIIKEIDIAIGNGFFMSDYLMELVVG